MRLNVFNIMCFAGLYFSAVGCSDDKSEPKIPLQLFSAKVGTENLNLSDFSQNTDLPFNQPILLDFSAALDEASVMESISLTNESTDVPVVLTLEDDDHTIRITPEQNLTHNAAFTIHISDELKGANNEFFPGLDIDFTTIQGTITIASVVIDGQTATTNNRIMDVDRNPTVVITFSAAVNTSTISNSTILFLGTTSVPTLSFSFSDENKKVTITSNETLQHLRKYLLYLSPEIEGAEEEVFPGHSKNFYTEVDPTPKLPLLPNDEDNDADNTNDLLSVVQKQTFKYFYDFAHPASGLARERNTSGNVVTIGGSGFGVMALIVGMERGFITRAEGLARLNTILTFLETCDRYHGVWPHWLDGNTGDIIPFSPTDDGGDLVETSFMIQGLITMRQYLNAGVTEENNLITRINALNDAVEYDWYTRNENVLYWLWSPNNGYILKIQGHNETLITYLLAASSTAHPVSPLTYSSGYSRNGAMVNGSSYYGIQLPLGQSYGGPLFFTHYSYLGLYPGNLSDQFATYWTQNVNHSLINHAYCLDNPKNFVGYSDECWGLTASDNHQGYSAHSPTNDLGVITPTAAISSLPYTPVESMKALKFFYYTMGDRLWGQYGFYDAFNPTENWYASSYLAIDQGPIIVMIENYRTSLLWNLFMSAPEVQAGLDKLDFNY